MKREISLDKYEGAMLAAAIGDSLGWPNEGRALRVRPAYGSGTERLGEMLQWKKKSGGRFWPFTETVRKGEYSDDTQLILSVARSLAYGAQQNTCFAKMELPLWLDYERGGGSATKKAAKKWSRNIPPWDLEKNSKEDLQAYFQSGGNGIAMRILPIVLYYAENTEAMRQHIFINGINTHGHPRALLGSLLYGEALRYLLTKNTTLEYGELIDYLLEHWKSWSDPSVLNSWEKWYLSAKDIFDIEKLWKKTVKECRALLVRVKDRLNEGALDFPEETCQLLGATGKENGSGTITAVMAVYLASKFASSPIEGLCTAASLFGADTDTLASMTGGLLGALHGVQWMKPDWYTVQDSSYIKALAHQLFEKTTISASPESEQIVSLEGRSLKQVLKNVNTDFSGFYPVFKNFKVNSIMDLSNTSNNHVWSYELSSEIGQTIYVRVFEKAQINQQRSLPLSLTAWNQSPVPESEHLNQISQISAVEESSSVYSVNMHLTKKQKNVFRTLSAVLPKKVPAKEFLELILFIDEQNADDKNDTLILRCMEVFEYNWLNEKLLCSILEQVR